MLFSRSFSPLLRLFRNVFYPGGERVPIVGFVGECGAGYFNMFLLTCYG